MSRFALLLGLCLTPTVALAAPSGDGTHQAARDGLKEVAVTEGQIIDDLLKAIEVSSPLPLSDSARAEWEAAQKAHSQAKALWQKKQYRQAYSKYREANRHIESPLTEILEMPEPPQNVVDAAARQVDVTASLLEELADTVAANGSAEAKSAYTAAKADYRRAEKLWRSPATRSEAAELCWSAMEQADVAVRAMWGA